MLGGLLVSAAAGALWYGGLAPSHNDEAARDATWNSLAARIAAVETQIRAVPKQTAAAAGADPKAVEDLNTRLAKLETAGATPRATPDPALTGRLDATESTAKSLSTDLSNCAGAPTRMPTRPSRPFAAPRPPPPRPRAPRPPRAPPVPNGRISIA